MTLDNLVTGWQDAVKFVPFERGDLLSRSDIDCVFEKYAPVAVMHFAALSQVGESMQKPGLYWQNNVIGSLNLIQSAVYHGYQGPKMSTTILTRNQTLLNSLLLTASGSRKTIHSMMLISALH